MNRIHPLLLVLTSSVALATESDVFFYEKVVPIFQRRCIGCHSDGDHKGDFSVESAKLALTSGFIEPGDVDGSRMIEVITPVDGKAEMPKNADPMTEAEIQTLRRWVEEGASWPSGAALSATSVNDFDWWSLQPLVRPNVPEPSKDSLVRTPIDAFIYSKWKEQGLSGSPEADRQTLVRRLYFDLIGLPPAPDDVEAFVNDRDEQAYEKLVDRLLDSKHYGERWARHWLDVVHYADTHGYDKDKLRPNAWPYRDYVIRSFNEDKPYGRFVREQIAGDVFWPDTLDGITATGFIAAGPWDHIGHAEVPESKIDGRIARHLDRDDMVSSTLNTFASTTVQCARCHNHKFDPITQEHYYSLQSVFAALDRADRKFDADAETARQRASLGQRLTLLESKRERMEAEVAKLGGETLASLDKQLEALKSQQASEVRPEFGYHSQLAEKQDDQKWFQIDLGKQSVIQRLEFVGAHDNFNNIGAGFGFPLRYKIEVSNDATFASSVALVDQTDEDLANPGIQLQAISVPNGTSGRYVRMTATKLALRKVQYFFALGEFRVLSESGVNVAKGMPVSSFDSIEAPSRWQRKNLVDGYWHGQGPAADLPARLKEMERERSELIATIVPDTLQQEMSTVREQLNETKAAIDALPKQSVVYAGTIHHGSGAFKGTGAAGGKPRTIHVLHRGDILQPRQLAMPGRIPLSRNDEWQFDLDDDHTEGARRAALAHWFTDPDHPLTWRSIVNRIWQYHFGRGIVDTPNDFGRMGGMPTHPELLDWLAVEFRDGEQSIKQLHKLIVMSAVYRQQSSHDDAQARIDSGNQFLWRMNRRRLSAEEVRDAVLHVSGSLNPEMFGPGIRLFVLERAEHSPHYEYHKHDPGDPHSHRRSIYRFIVRSQPDPFMTALDCADSSQSVPKRDETVTALQALSLLNNKFMLAMAKDFSARVKAEETRAGGQVRMAYRLALGHPPSKEQQRALVSYTRDHGLENTCRLLFNLNEFVFVD